MKNQLQPSHVRSLIQRPVRAISLIGVVMMTSGFLSAQSDIIWVRDLEGMTAGGTGYLVPVQLVNENELSGFQFDLSYDASALTIDTLYLQGRASGFDLFTNSSSPGTMTVIPLTPRLS